MEKRSFFFDKFNTWYDWRLTLTAKSIPDPEPKTNYIDLEGVSGSIDLSEALTGEVCYGDRTLTASFMCSEGTHGERERLLRKIASVLHGKKVQIIEPDDPDHYFWGRVRLKKVSNHIAYTEFSLEATCEPWRYAVHETERTVTNARAVIYNYGVKSLCPTLTVIGPATVTVGGTPTTLESGTYQITDLRLMPGPNVVGVSGTVTFTYREATL